MWRWWRVFVARFFVEVCGGIVYYVWCVCVFVNVYVHALMRRVCMFPPTAHSVCCTHEKKQEA